jgi:dihydrofolate reductase
MEDVLDYFDYTEDDIFIIGGGSIYNQLLPFCDRVYVTKIYKDNDNVDTYFPNLDKSEEWAPAACSNLRIHNDLSYQFWQYDRIS